MAVSLDARKRGRCGDTLDEGREGDCGAPRFSFDTDRLPEIREYIEREAHMGIWVRTSMTSPVADNAFKQIANQISLYPDEDREWFYRRPTAGGDPVAVACGTKPTALLAPV